MRISERTALVLTMAISLAGLQASVTEHQPPAPLPEFKTPDQLAKWRADTTVRSANQESTSSRLSTQDSSTPFYTGKPYLAESGSYAFKYREYNPEMGRWTTVDPSGFPDGANNSLYVKNNCIRLIDNNGLSITKPGIPDWPSATVANIILSSFKFTTIEYDINTSEGKVWDSYTANWTADVTMTFNNPFTTNTDPPTKSGSSSVSTTTSGSIPPIGVPALIPGPAISIDSSIVDKVVSDIVETAWTSFVSSIPNSDKLGISKSNIEGTINSILQNKPTAANLAKLFSTKDYPIFTE